MYFKDIETDQKAKRDHDAAQKAIAAKRFGRGPKERKERN